MITTKFYAPGEDFAAVKLIREKVFCEEQGYPVELEYDELDALSLHLAVFDDETPVACGRLSELADKEFKLGRIAVLKPYRGKKLGALIMNELIAKAKELGAKSLSLGAQTYAVPFYERFGFSAYGVEYYEEHLPHVHMKRNLIFDGCEWLEFFDGAEAVYFRREFECEDIINAQIDISALGFFELFINGERATEDLNIPAWSEYEKRPLEKINMPILDTLSHRIYYLNYDISNLIKNGANTLGVHIGNGWYGQHESRNEGFTRCGELKLCYKITVTKKSGDTVTFVSDGKGKYTQSPIIRSNIYFGETHDLRLSQNAWNKNAFDDSAWGLPHAVKAPKALICKQECPPDKIIRSIQPTLLRKFGDCSLYDLGEAVAGYAVLKYYDGVRSDEHTYVRYADELREDGSLNFHSTGGESRMQRDCFISQRDNTELLYPRFTWHAGRYFEILGNAELVEFRVVHTDMECLVEFESSNENLNWLFEAYIRTQQNNVHCCVPSDCPHRERLGYTGDGQITCRAVMTAFDAKEMYRKWMQDIADGQDRYNGHVQHTAPFYGGGGGPGGWGGAIAIVPWNFYLFYGEKDILTQYYPHMIKYLHYMDMRSKASLVVREEDFGWCLGDWCPPEKLELPESFVNTYYLVKCLEIAKAAAKIIGETKDNEFIDKKITACKTALVDNYFDEASGSFCGGVQGADAYMFDIALGDERLLENIVNKYEGLGRYDTGIFGTDILTRTLFQNGYPSLAFKLLSNDSDVSFSFMKRSGATTLWEEWDGRNSHSHPMFGAVVEYLFAYILGIRQKSGSTAWAAYEINPAHIPELEWARGKIKTPAGTICVDVKNTSSKTEFKFEIE